MSWTLEKDIERKLVRMVERHGGKCLKWTCPGWSGVPDRIILLPGGHAMFAETKRPKDGRPSAMQRKWREWLTGLGFWSVFVYNETDIQTLELVIIDTIARRSKT